MREKLRPFIIPTVISAIAGLSLILGLSAKLDWKLYDLMFHARSAPQEEKSVLLVDMDDAAIAEIGTWPVGRDVIAEGLAALGELGAKTVTFDIEYVDSSPRGVDVRYLNEEIPDSFTEGFGALSENIAGLFTALSKRQIPLSAAEDYVKELQGLTNNVRDELLSRVRKIAADNDERLGKAARFFGNAYFTVNMRKEAVPGQGRDALKLAVQKAGSPYTPTAKGLIQKAVGLLPTIDPILSGSAGAGFPNVYVDADGVRRRIDLFYEFDGNRYAQLVMAPLLASLGSPDVVIDRHYYNIKGAKFPSGEVADIKIPRAQDGRMLIDWPHKRYLESFRHISFRKLIVHEKLYADLAHNLRIRDSWGYFSSYQGAESLAALAARAQDFKRDGLTGEAAPPEGASSELRGLRDGLLAECQAFLAARPEEAIVDEVERLLAEPRLDAETRAQYELIKKDAPEYFASTRSLVEALAAIRSELKAETKDSFCIIGYTATGTTDIGVNPFDGEYVNVGTHAAIYNTLLHRSFIREAPAWLPFLVALLASFGLAFLIQGRTPALAISLGMGLTVLIAFGLTAALVFANLFIHPTVPILACFLTFLSSTILNFFKMEREKSFLRNAFSHYLSTEVIKEIVSDPSKLRLGGTKKTMTAMFTDIRGFSTVSEKLPPEDLVRLLNRYLSGMSDVILDLKGTIDKYEGDAIIAFFGAPIDLPDHATRCCRAAIKMKRLEEQLNERFLADGIAPSPLLTRVGINTGDMVVGNMGTERKMDYTIIGDAVNLAARLEGVNKQYGTWICAAEDTVRETEKDFLFRRLDRIRVVGKSQSIRIYELIDEHHALDKKRRDFFASFEEAMALFEAREWTKAKALFQACLAEKPEDGPSKLYVGRCEGFEQKPPAAEWDGVYNLTTK